MRALIVAMLMSLFAAPAMAACGIQISLGGEVNQGRSSGYELDEWGDKYGSSFGRDLGSSIGIELSWSTDQDFWCKKQDEEYLQLQAERRQAEAEAHAEMLEVCIVAKSLQSPALIGKCRREGYIQ